MDALNPQPGALGNEIIQAWFNPDRIRGVCRPKCSTQGERNRRHIWVLCCVIPLFHRLQPHQNHGGQMTTPNEQPVSQTPETDEASKPNAKWIEPPVCGSVARRLEKERNQANLYRAELEAVARAVNNPISEN